MKRLLPILILLSCAVTSGAQSGVVGVIAALSAHKSDVVGSVTPPPPAETIIYVKDMQPTAASASTGYRSFGTCFQTSDSFVTYIYHYGTSKLVSGQYSYAHLWQGVTAQVSRNIYTGVEGPEIVIDSEADGDLSDCYGMKMRDGRSIYFSSVSPANIKELSIGQTVDNSGAPAQIFFRIADDSTLQWGPRRNLLTDSGAINPPEAQHSGTIFGAPVAGPAPGEYYASLITFNYAGADPNHGYCVRTTDNWSTWSFYPIWAATGYSETAIAHMGDAKVVALRRQDQGGGIGIFYSSDSGKNWTGGGNIQYNGWDGAFARIITPFADSGKLHLLVTNRDTYFEEISKGNDTADFFGQMEPTFNPAEVVWYVGRNTEDMVYAHTSDPSGNPVLGYAGITPIKKHDSLAGYYFQAGKEIINVGNGLSGRGVFEAKIYATFLPDLFETDPGGLPAPADSLGANYFDSTLTGNFFRLSTLGYTDQELQNITNWRITIASDSLFTTYPNVRVNVWNSTPRPVVDMRKTALWMTIYGLVPGQVLWIKEQAENHTGLSDFYIKKVTVPE